MNIKFDFIEINNPYKLLYSMLPNQGCLEFQRDSPFKEHKWHTHSNDETLLILEGEMEVYYEEGSKICSAGDIIYLPSMKKHGSKALSNGAVYAIATEFIDFNV
ncbi:cupin [Xenorhabdus beddingii]|uniref:Cupin n=1 Tax=Xenorhabdus beddingii TaxID=40578 RepID=A0A1Y2SBL2_9GAMM|nr:cupin domain-containing protein [Xenorhabdus beddingii]OTA15304.1 cupin [Xenorhabdus beddingii]